MPPEGIAALEVSAYYTPEAFAVRTELEVAQMFQALIEILIAGM